MSDAQAVPAEVQSEIGKTLKGLPKDKESLLKKYNEMVGEGDQLKPDEVNLGWLKKKVPYLIQDAIFAKHNVAPPEKVQTNHEKVNAEDKKASASGKGGRKRMSTAGKFVIQLGEGQSPGREGSVKGDVTRALIEKKVFEYSDFEAAVAEVMQWDPKAEKFGRETKFANLNAASRAWFSELKNKSEIIVPEGTEPAPASA
jgi:hypothetical protein